MVKVSWARVDSGAEDLQIGKLQFHRPLGLQVEGRGAGVLRQLA